MTEISHIALSRIIRISPLNPRADVETDITMLKASILATGQTYPLIIRAVPYDASGFEVIDGARRWRAQREIAAQTGAQDIIIPAIVIEGASETQARALSVAIGVTARALHPVDEYEAFAALEKSGQSVGAIAEQFGLSEKQVRQRLALGELAPRLRQMWREGEIDDAAAKVWACAPVASQEALLADWVDDTRIDDPVEIRRALTLDRMRAYDRVAKHILAHKTVCEAYIAAGGRIEESLFSDDIELLDPAIARQAVAARLRHAAETVAAEEGWGYPRTEDDADFAQDYDEPDAELTEAEETRLAAIMIEKQCEDADTAALNDEIRAIERDALLREFPPDERHELAVVACLDNTGYIYFLRGCPLNAQHAAQTDAPASDSRDDNHDDDGEDPSHAPGEPGEASDVDDDGAKDITPHDPAAELPRALAKVVSACVDVALPEAVRTRPDIAMAILVAWISSSDGAPGISPLWHRAQRQRRCAVMRDIEGKSFLDALDMCASEPLADLTAALAEAAAMVLTPANIPNGALARICAAMRQRGAPLAALFSNHLDREAFFDAAPKAMRRRIIAGLIGENEARQSEKLKAPDRARHAARISADKGHLPSPLADWAGAPETEAAQEALHVDGETLAGAMNKALTKSKPGRKPKPTRRALPAQEPAAAETVEPAAAAQENE